MSAPATITIRRQVLDVELQGTHADGLELQRRLPAICADVLSPALEAELARFDPGDAYLYIERLEVAVAGVVLDRLEVELAEAVRAAVADLRGQSPAPGVTGPAAASVASGGSGVELRTWATVVDDALVVFLRTGRLPWSFRLPPGMPLEQLAVDVWQESTGGGIPASALARLADVLTSGAARTRLLMQFSPPFVRRLLRAWSPALVLRVEEALTVLDVDPPAGDAGPTGEADFTRAVWEAALAAAAAGSRPATADLARTAWENLSALDRDGGPCGLGRLARVLESRWPGVSEGAAGQGGPSTDSAVASADPRARPSRAVAEPLDDEEADTILVDNAGLVLVHPFVPRLFEALEVADADRLVDPARALCLLHHLATGELTAPEHRLTLAKVLCNVPLDQPAEADVGLTEDEAAEASSLLESLIRHWAALGSTSRGALRGEFLMRPGMLTTHGDAGWQLRVEPRTADILLDQLPWGISMIKLPWMTTLLRVEWR